VLFLRSPHAAGSCFFYLSSRGASLLYPKTKTLFFCLPSPFRVLKFTWVRSPFLLDSQGGVASPVFSPVECFLCFVQSSSCISHNMVHPFFFSLSLPSRSRVERMVIMVLSFEFLKLQPSPLHHQLSASFRIPYFFSPFRSGRLKQSACCKAFLGPLFQNAGAADPPPPSAKLFEPGWWFVELLYKNFFCRFGVLVFACPATTKNPPQTKTPPHTPPKKRLIPDWEPS